MTFVKMASSTEELYEVKESLEEVTDRLFSDLVGWVTLTTQIDGDTGDNGVVVLNISRIEAVWPS